MVDLAKTVAPKSDQMNYDDLIAGPRTITVTRVSASDTPDQPVSVYFEGDNGKPWKPCKSMRRVLIAAWGPDAATFAGRSLTLYGDPDVQFGGMKVGGIRVSHMSHIDAPLNLALTATKAKRAIYTVKPLAAERTAAKPAGASDADVKAKARNEARNGKEAFAMWWNSDEGKRSRDAVRPILTELQQIAADAEKNHQAPIEDPFTRPDDAAPTMTPEQQALFDAAARDAFTRDGADA